MSATSSLTMARAARLCPAPSSRSISKARTVGGKIARVRHRQHGDVERIECQAFINSGHGPNHLVLVFRQSFPAKVSGPDPLPYHRALSL
jgi:hypothetical protein